MAEVPFSLEAAHAAERRDAAGREVIRYALDQNIMVQAGAGAGKTHEMITRMVERVVRGAPVEQLAAITFTRKAAGEMRGRFFRRMQDALAEVPPEARPRLQKALRAIDQCYIGTIHSFCGRMLRERPAEAGIAPDFTEIDAREEQELRRKAWRTYLQACDPALLDRLRAHGVRPRDLFDFFGDLCLFSDLRLYSPEAPRPDLVQGVERVRRFVTEHAGQVPPRPLAKQGYDSVQQALIEADLFLSHHGVHTDGDRARLLQLFAGLEGKVTLNRWGDRGSDAYAYARDLRDVHVPELVSSVAPLVEAWEAYLYPVVAAFCVPAVQHYDRLRAAEGKMTFQDLLVRARDLLRDHPNARRFFQGRYCYLYVDEFQDTDPVQAEILFYLTDTQRLEERDWMKLQSEAGRLFLVGDGKQSIYRFRRADYETFQVVQERVRTHGQVVTLQRSFRARENLCLWANGAFPSLFERHREPHQAPFRELLPWEEKRDSHSRPRVRQLTVDYKYGNKPAAIAADEAGRIAAFIAALVRGDDAGVKARYVEQGLLPEDIGYGDFMILTRNTTRLNIYAEALEQLGIPYDLTGAGKLGAVPEVLTLLQLLEAVYDPDDAIALLAFLRGPLAGLSDQDIYAFHRAGGTLCYRRDIPPGLADDLVDSIASAFGLLRKAEDLLTSMPPSAALDLILDEFGLVVHAATRPGGSSRAGSLLKVLSICRGIEAQGGAWIDVLEELQEVVRDDTYKVEELTLEAGAIDDRGRPEAVRVMNLHKAKGLEAKVVFLVEPYSPQGGGQPHFHVVRGGEQEPYVVLPVSRVPSFSSRRTILCRPQGWADYEATERSFLEAEEQRLLYVAATRAEELLVVSRYTDRKGEVKDGYWSALYDALEGAPELETCDVSAVEPEPWEVDLEDVQAAQAALRRSLKEPTYTLARASGAADEGPASDGGHGAAYGRVVHRLFEAVLAGRIDHALAETYVRRLLIDEGAPPSQQGPVLAALRSLLEAPLGRQVVEARRGGRPVLTEVPFAAGRDGTVLRGTIDLVARLEDGWHIIDFKTDMVGGEEDIERLAAHYAPQVKAYVQGWEEATGVPVAAAGLWLTEVGRFAAVHGESPKVQ